MLTLEKTPVAAISDTPEKIAERLNRHHDENGRPFYPSMRFNLEIFFGADLGSHRLISTSYPTRKAAEKDAHEWLADHPTQRAEIWRRSDGQTVSFIPALLESESPATLHGTCPAETLCPDRGTIYAPEITESSDCPKCATFWKVNTGPFFNRGIVIEDEDGQEIADVSIPYLADEDEDAPREKALERAHLFAAAPEMLKALQNLLAFTKSEVAEDFRPDVITRAESAISRAQLGR